MRSTILATIPSEPHPQGRARGVLTRSGLRVMDPTRSRAWKDLAAAYLRGSMAGRAPLEGAVAAGLLFVFSLPVSRYRSSQVPRRWCALAKGDADNLAKAVLDAGNRILWADDRQVALLPIATVIGAQGEAPRVEVAVRPLEGLPSLGLSAQGLLVSSMIYAGLRLGPEELNA